MIGRTIEQYRILSKIGSGGMGSVYKAYDTKLDRTVALKFLHLDMSDDETAKRRFIQEARAASALDHPNICTVYDISETAEGQLYIAMSYYEGETLKERMGRGLLSVGDALNIASQIAEGVKAAHHAGIVHRDLKPANIFVTRGDLVKILDFGLAKIADSQVTRTGTTVGTTAYMSPEQLQGESVDGQADIWSFGVILYELLAGRRPFDGPYPQAIMYAVVNQSHSRINTHSVDLQVEIMPFMNRLLAKKKSQRFESIDVVAAELLILVKRLSDRSLGGKHASYRAYMIQRAGTWVGLAIVVVAGIYLVRSIMTATDTPGTQVQVDDLHAIQLTLVSGFAQSPSFSRSGEFVAYSSLNDGSLNIVKENASSGAEVPLTSLSVSATDPAWSPDQDRIAYSQAGGGVYVMEADGSSSTQLSASGSHPAWSRDGSRIAYDDDGDIFIVQSRRSGITLEEPQRIVSATGSADTHVIWGPRDRTLLYWSRSAGDLAVFHLDRAKEDFLQLVPTSEEIGGLSVTATGELFYSRGTFGGNQILWRVQLDLDRMTVTDSPQHLTRVGGDYASCDAAFDGTKIVCIQRNIVRRLYSLALDPKTGLLAEGAEPELLTPGPRNEYPAFSPDGSKLVWTSHDQGSGQLYILDISNPERGPPRKVTREGSDAPREVGGQFFSNSDSLVFTSTADSVYKLVYVSGLGNAAEDLIVPPANGRDVSPVLSPTRRDEYVFFSTRQVSPDEDVNFNIWVVRTSESLIPKPLTTWPRTDLYPSWAPNGEKITFISDRDGDLDVWIMDRDGANQRMFEGGHGEEAWPVWHPKRNWLYFPSNRDGTFNVYRKDADTGAVLRVTHFTDVTFGLPEQGMLTKVAVSESRLIVPLEDRQAQIVVFPILREQ